MENKRVEKRNFLKKRILKNIFVVLTLSMMISTGISYFFFQKVVREQKIYDEEVKQQQISRQMEFMMEDIRNFSRSIIVDDAIQTVMENPGNDIDFEGIKRKDNVSKRLRLYNSLRTYIYGSFIEAEDGEGYSSNASGQVKMYVQQRMMIPQLKAFKEHPDWVFSDIYYGNDSWDSEAALCYRAPIFDKYNFGRQIGTLYLDISLEHILEAVKNYGQEYENVCLTGNDGYILYEENESHPVSRLINMDKKYEQPGIHKVEGGYLICKDIADGGFKLYNLISDDYLWERSSFVLRFFFLSFLFSLAAILFSTDRLMEGIIQPIIQLSRKMENTHYDKLQIQEMVQTGDEIQILYECYNDMVGEIQRGMEQRMEYEKQKKEMEFDILLSQINPHYLYNVLNTVVYLSAMGKNREVVEIANALIYSLQETLRLGDKNIETTIKTELELTRCYLKIQEYRYPETFKVTIECPETMMDYSVPKTIIQPLVENAILHGILPEEENGSIQISIRQEEETLVIAVQDDGVGITDEHLTLFEQGHPITYGRNDRKHIGISNVRDRIRYLYGEPYGMWIERLPERGTRVTLRLPVIKYIY